jgi:hypothetical protein
VVMGVRAEDVPAPLTRPGEDDGDRLAHSAFRAGPEGDGPWKAKLMTGR